MLIGTDSSQVCNAVEYNMLYPHYKDPERFLNISLSNLFQSKNRRIYLYYTYV